MEKDLILNEEQISKEELIRRALEKGYEITGVTYRGGVNGKYASLNDRKAGNIFKVGNGAKTKLRIVDIKSGKEKREVPINSVAFSVNGSSNVKKNQKQIKQKQQKFIDDKNLNKEKEEKLLSVLKTTVKKENIKKSNGISNFERNFVKVLRKNLPKIIPGFNGVIKYGEEGTQKELSGIKSIGGKTLDYDICFELPRPINGYKKVAINLDGPTHNAAVTYWETRQNDYLRLPIVKGDPETLFLRKEISFSENDEDRNKNKKNKSLSKEIRVYNHIVGELLHEIKAALYDDDSEELRIENKLKQKFNYNKATEEEKKKIDELISKEKERARSGMDIERERAQSYAVEKALLDIKQAIENAKTRGQNTKYEVKDKHGYKTGQIKDLKDFIETEQGQKSLRKNLMPWSEVTKPDINIQHWIAKHQAGQGQINYDSKNYPIDNKKFIKLFEEIRKRTSK